MGNPHKCKVCGCTVYTHDMWIDNDGMLCPKHGKMLRNEREPNIERLEKELARLKKEARLKK